MSTSLTCLLASIAILIGVPTSGLAAECMTMGAEGRHCMEPAISRDDVGNFTVVWVGWNEGHTQSTICVQKLDSHGNVYWPANDVVAADYTSTYLVQPNVCSVGSSEVVITWLETNGVVWEDGYRLKAQKLSAQGARLWGASGVTVAEGGAWDPQLVPGADGGVYIVWQDSSSYATHAFDISAQRIDTNGNLMWAPVSIEATTLWEQLPRACTDGQGGVFIAWRHDLNNALLKMRKLSPQGVDLWTSHVVIAGSNLQSTQNKIVADGSGGVVATWVHDATSTSTVRNQLLSQRIDQTGNLLWGAGVLVGDYISTIRVKLARSGDRFIFGWSSHGGYTNILTRSVNGSGELEWSSPILITNTPSLSELLDDLSVDDAGNICLTWQQHMPARVMSQVVSPSGICLWSEPKELCTGSDADNVLRCAFAGQGIGMLVWEQWPNIRASIFSISSQAFDWNRYE